MDGGVADTTRHGRQRDSVTDLTFFRVQAGVL